MASTHKLREWELAAQDHQRAAFRRIAERTGLQVEWQAVEDVKRNLGAGIDDRHAEVYRAQAFAVFAERLADTLERTEKGTKR
jgi:hypothetical protein